MELILLVLFGIVVWALGVKSGWDARERHASKITKQFLDAMQDAEEDQEELLHIVIENHNDMLFVYDKDTEQFMAQGSTREDVEKVLVERFPGKRFACHESILKEVGFIP
jgi:hypothetical protein